MKSRSFHDLPKANEISYLNTDLEISSRKRGLVDSISTPMNENYSGEGILHNKDISSIQDYYQREREEFSSNKKLRP